ncbi:MAG: LuxR C-terminal-related transcriptional regulator [bacterium]|nr:LuxR C-terminal-related transcriptional regulator [bacterium]
MVDSPLPELERCTHINMAGVVAGAEREVLCFLVAELTPAALESAGGVISDLLERGVLLRFIYLDTNVTSPEVRGFAADLTERGGLARSVPSLPVRLALVDGRAAVVASAAPGRRDEGLIVRSPELLDALGAMFEEHWERATPIHVSAPLESAAGPLTRTAAPISRQEQNLLTLLAHGRRDAEIARTLGVSERSVSRMISGLFERTASSTRFELGVKASRFDWV